jgi:hypothetical protein
MRTLIRWASHATTRMPHRTYPRPRRHSRAELASLKRETHAWVRDPNYNTPKLRLEAAHAAAEAALVEARRPVRLNEGQGE